MNWPYINRNRFSGVWLRWKCNFIYLVNLIYFWSELSFIYTFKPRSFHIGNIYWQHVLFIIVFADVGFGGLWKFNMMPGCVRQAVSVAQGTVFCVRSWTPSFCSVTKENVSHVSMFFDRKMFFTNNFSNKWRKKVST